MRPGSGARLLWPLLLLLGGCGLFGGKDEPIEPPAELTSIEPTLRISEAWEVRVGPGSELLGLALQPALEGGRVYAAGRDGEVHALDLETGEAQWTVETGLSLSAGPAAGHGMVVVAGSKGDIAALDIANGNPLWSATLSSEVLAKPALSASVIAVRTVDGALRGLSAENGRQLWVVERQPPRLSMRGTAGAVIAADRVVTGFDDGRIGAYELRTGEPAWENVLSVGRGRTEIERLADVDATPQVVGGDLYAVGYDGRLASLALGDGRILWAVEMSSYKDLGVDWTSVYLSDTESEVVALNRSSGGELWRQDALRMRALTAPTPFGDSVVVGDFEGWLHWLDSITGTLQARYRAGGAAFATAPVSGGELLIAQDEDDRVYALRVEPRD